MDAYYDLVHEAMRRLESDGHAETVASVLAAERMSSTSGEAISNIGVILRAILSQDLSRPARALVVAVLDEGERLWLQSNQ